MLTRDHYKAMFEKAFVAIILIDAKSTILEANAAAIKLFGYQRDELIGNNLTILMEHDDARDHHIHIQKYLKTGTPNILDKTREVVALHKQGHLLHLHLCVNELDMDGKKTFVGYMLDTSNIKVQKKRNFEIRLIHELSKIQAMYIEGVSPNTLFDYILHVLLELTQSQYGFIGLILFDENKNRYLKTLAITNVAWNEETKKFYNENAPQGLEFHNLDTLFGYTIRTGEVVITNDPLNHPASGGLPEGHPGLQSYLGMPIYGNAGLIAMVGIANREGGYEEEDIKLVQPIFNILSSIIEATKQNVELEQLAKVDKLTEVSNRAHFDNTLAMAIKKSKIKNFALMIIDLDRFKDINDNHGHLAGDFVLKTTAKRIYSAIRGNDLVARIGGDEFAAIIYDISSVSSARKIAKSIISAIASDINYEGHILNISASIGIALFPEDGSRVTDLLKSADADMYKVKQRK